MLIKMEFTLNVFTLNCWGIPVVSKHRKERMQAIAKYLLDGSHNIVCLQEIWSEKDYLYLKETLQAVLPYSYYFYSGVLGSGLCVFSKWMIQDVFFHQWPLNGYIHKIHHGDWFGGKGVGLCRITVNDKLINVFCTHLHAEYHDDDMYLAHRALQAYSTAEFINLTKSSADISILAGDLNTGPGDLSFRLITQLPSLLDPFDLKCVGSNPQIREATGTCDNSNNSYSNPKQAKLCAEGKRIDHILFHSDTFEAEVINFGNPLPDRVANKPFSYSDHNAVCLELKLKPTSSKMTVRQRSKDATLNGTIEEAIKVCSEATATISTSKKLFLVTGGLIFFFLIGTIDFLPNTVVYNVIKLLLSCLCFYNILMGTLWNRIEANSLKAGFTAMTNFNKSCKEVKLANDMNDGTGDHS